MANHLPEALPCPICKGRPDIDICTGWPRDLSPPAWYANCYSTQPIEHCIGGNGDNQREAVEVWNKAVHAHVSSQKDPL